MATQLRVLLVEDLESDAALIVRQLTKAGREVDWERVETASEMRAALERRDWDVVIADYQLPAFDAPAALTTLKQTGLDLPFIVVSGQIGEETAVALMRTGAHDFVMKQNLTRLAPAVERELRDARVRRERLQASEQLRESQHLVERILGATPALIHISDIVDRCNVYANRSVEDFLGYTADQIRGAGPQLFQEVLHPEDADRVAQHRARFSTVGDNDILEIEYRIRRSDGQWRWLHSRDVLFARNATGEPRSILCSMGDVTERKRAEDALRESDERHQTILQTAMDGFWLVDMQGRLLEVNETYCRMSGYSVQELLAMRIPDLEISETADDVAAHTKRIMAQGADRFESRHRRKDGSIFDVEVSVQYQPTDSGRFVVFLQDVTDRKRAGVEKAKLEAQFHQAQKMESVGRLAGGVAHDFNNLLTVINGYSQMLLSDLKVDDPLRDSIEEIHKAGERAAGLTRQLLAFSRKQVLEPRRLDVNHMVEELRPMLTRLMGEDVELRVALRGEGRTVRADPHQLEQVLMNLAVNARDAMPAGGKLLIETALVERDESYCQAHPDARAGPYIMLAISDDGVGMDEETRQRIFEPFFTTKEAGKGTGLGLSMVQGIVAQSGGYINVYSEPGQGTSFKVYLPALDEAAAEGSQQAAVPTLGGKETVLVVEDQAEVRKYAVAVLKSKGYRVIPAESAGEALLLCERERIDLVLTDVVMPNVSGRELAERLEKLQPGIKVLFMSGYTDNVIEQRGVLEKGAGFIQKPFSPEELARKVRAVLAPTVRASRILVADDEPGVRAFLRNVLENVGYEVIEANDGEKAIRQALGGGVDLVIMNLVMPEQEGLETIETLRRDVPGAGIIAISGAFGGQFLRTAQLLGADAVMNKPVSAELLLAKVAEVLKTRRSEVPPESPQF
jgi:two-component system cell cycle sensor histidine kinase/response regulator CckA